jgi:opacity protein-like surface antigen
MRRNLVGMMTAFALAAVAAAPAVAQETGTPIYKAPYRSFQNYELGLSLSFPNGRDVGVEGFYTYGSGANDFGLRGGFVSGNDITQIVAGGNFRTRLISYSDKFPLDGALTVGAGFQVGDGPDILMIPVGLSLGRRFRLEGSSTTFTPYVHPIIAPVFGNNIGGFDDDNDILFALGLGVDMKFNRSLSARVSGGVGDDLFEGIGFGLAWAH